LQEEVIILLNERQTEQFRKEILKILSLGLEITGELIEIALTQVYPESKRITLNSKDKKWIDVIAPDKGIEVKTFQVAKSARAIVEGMHVDNVLKRVSKVNHLEENNSERAASTIGSDIISYLHSTIDEHSREKGVSGEKVMGIVFRTVDNTAFGYWEQPLNFGEPTDYTWDWNTTTNSSGNFRTIVGRKDNNIIFKWYCNNQKQLFYHYQVPSNAVFFSISKEESSKKVYILSEEEIQQMIESEVSKRLGK
jgi:hypothetical protein